MASFESTVYSVERLPASIAIGVQTEKGVKDVLFDVSSWLESWPEMQVSVWCRRPRERSAYLSSSQLEGSILRWRVSAADTSKAGVGKVEIMGTTPDGSRKLTGAVVATVIADTITATTQDPPSAAPTWVETVQKMIDSSGGGGGSCGCVEATMEEVLEALLEADGIPALMVDDSALYIDDSILVV